MSRKEQLYSTYWDPIVGNILNAEGGPRAYELPPASKNGGYPTETATTLLSAYLVARDDPGADPARRDRYFEAFKVQMNYAHDMTQDGLVFYDGNNHFCRDPQARQIVNFALAHRLLIGDERMSAWMQAAGFSLLEWADTAANAMITHFERHLYPYDASPSSYSLLFAAIVEPVAGHSAPYRSSTPPRTADPPYEAFWCVPERGLIDCNQNANIALAFILLISTDGSVFHSPGPLRDLARSIVIHELTASISLQYREIDTQGICGPAKQKLTCSGEADYLYKQGGLPKGDSFDRRCDFRDTIYHRYTTLIWMLCNYFISNNRYLYREVSTSHLRDPLPLACMFLQQNYNKPGGSIFARRYADPPANPNTPDPATPCIGKPYPGLDPEHHVTDAICTNFHFPSHDPATHDAGLIDEMWWQMLINKNFPLDRTQDVIDAELKLYAASNLDYLVLGQLPGVNIDRNHRYLVPASTPFHYFILFGIDQSSWMPEDVVL